MSTDKRLIIAILRNTEGNEVLNALLEADFRVTRIASTGSFMRRGNATLLVGVNETHLPNALQIIRDHSAPAIDPGLKRANVFVLKVDQFEQL